MTSPWSSMKNCSANGLLSALAAPPATGQGSTPYGIHERGYSVPGKIEGEDSVAISLDVKMAKSVHPAPLF